MKYFFSIFLLVLFLAGCTSNEANMPGETNRETVEETDSIKEKQKIFIEYITEDIGEVGAFEREAIASFKEVSGDNFVDDKTLYEKLVTEVIPSYKKAVEAVNELEPELKELEGPTEKMKAAMHSLLASLELEKEAQDKQDQSIRNESGEKYEEYYDLMGEYHEEMKKIANKYDVEYESNEM